MDHAGPDTLIRSGLKFAQLRLLATLREVGQIGAAAQHVGMSQPAASRLLTQLEDLVGTPLYTRHARGVELTEAGHLLAVQAKATLHGLDLANDRIRQMIGGVRGLVRAGTVTGPSLEILLPVIRETRLAFPDLEMSVQVDTSDKLAEALLGRDLDFYIGRIPDGADTRPFAISMIGPEPIALVVRKDHPVTRQDPQTLEACLKFDWVTQPPGGLLRRTAETYILARGHALPKRILSTTSSLFTLAMINETNAIAPLARSMVDFFVESGSLGARLDRLTVAEDMVVAPYGIVTRAGDEFPPSVERILGMVAQHARRSVQAGLA
ncbi:LysR family transcriptional regulator [Anianabacter salinae]|uniref:LysR family transcriptional regulator n=1 Tax=Anianabacter salinae TaxID=2851023 RepID=UPI00225DD916|nr:LysR family transcriptional regulator [Anianabacter salinae]MBV0912792.1 LysR family transcriptional regulator [Anianabacter salinae]